MGMWNNCALLLWNNAHHAEMIHNENSSQLLTREHPNESLIHAYSEEFGTKPRMTTKYLTKFEKARILGTRALQISLNAPLMIDPDGETDPLEIALKELNCRKIPFIIRRYLPDGTHEDWAI